MLRLTNFSKSYNDSPILSIPSLEFQKGIHWIKGQNGSGKSTLFKCIAGLIPYEGTIELQNQDQRKDPVVYRRQINFAEAEPLYPGFLTAKDLIRFIGKTKGATRAQEELYTNRFGVDLYFEKPCEAYSSGMLKKLSLTLAFLGNPQVIILDEPIITLDDASRRILYDTISESYQKGISFLISSHQPLEDTAFQAHSFFQIKNKTLQPA
jgi:ABC-2 type transport system ATP-binding protein